MLSLSVGVGSTLVQNICRLQLEVEQQKVEVKIMQVREGVTRAMGIHFSIRLNITITIYMYFKVCIFKVLSNLYKGRGPMLLS